MDWALPPHVVESVPLEGPEERADCQRDRVLAVYVPGASPRRLYEYRRAVVEKLAAKRGAEVLTFAPSSFAKWPITANAWSIGRSTATAYRPAAGGPAISDGSWRTAC